MKDVLINIKGTQTIGEEKDVTELTTVGKFGVEDGKMFLSYDDSTSMGVEGVTATVKFEGENLVTIQRAGAMSNRLTIEKNKRHMCHYSTAFGDMMVGVFGEAIKNEITENGGNVYLKYTIDVNSGLVSQNEIEISVKRVESNVGSGK